MFYPEWMREIHFFETQAKREGFYSMKEFCEHYHLDDFYEKYYASRENDKEGVLDYSNWNGKKPEKRNDI